MLDQADGFSILEPGTFVPAESERPRDEVGIDRPIAADVIAEADSYPSLLAGLIARRKELGLPQSLVDELAGLTSAYTSKLECGMKRMGAMSLDALLGALGVKLVLVRTTPHHLRQRRIMGSACGTVRSGRGPAPSSS